MNHVIIGMGEVGRALFDVLSAFEDYKVGWKEYGESSNVPFLGPAHVMHVAMPYSENFNAEVRNYAAYFGASLVIVHSSVPVGTCDSNHWVHSPVRGVHPNIAKGIRTFVKYFGGLRSEEAADIFSALGVRTVAVPHARDTEAAKLWDTTQYGVQIVLMKAIYAWCRQHKVDFELVYTEFNHSYNEGYSKLDRREVSRPYLNYMPGPIGGHCVMQNLPLLGENFITNLVEEFNKQLVVEDLVISGQPQ